LRGNDLARVFGGVGKASLETRQKRHPVFVALPIPEIGCFLWESGCGLRLEDDECGAVLVDREIGNAREGFHFLVEAAGFRFEQLDEFCAEALKNGGFRNLSSPAACPYENVLGLAEEQFVVRIGAVQVVASVLELLPNSRETGNVPGGRGIPSAKLGRGQTEFRFLVRERGE